MSKQASRTNKSRKGLYRRSESTFRPADLFTFAFCAFTALRAATYGLRPRVGRRSAFSGIQAHGLNDAGKSESLAPTSEFMVVLTATEGRNLFCLDPSDTVSSSHRNRRGQGLDKEWNVPIDACPAASSSVW